MPRAVGRVPLRVILPAKKTSVNKPQSLVLGFRLAPFPKIFWSLSLDSGGFAPIIISTH